MRVLCFAERTGELGLTMWHFFADCSFCHRDECVSNSVQIKKMHYPNSFPRVFILFYIVVSFLIIFSIVPNIHSRKEKR